MKEESAVPGRQPVRFERTYDGPVDDLCELWTTKEGFEAWGRRLKLRHRIDFIPGVEPYDNDMVVELIPDGARVRMVVEIEPHRDEHWTRQSAQGFESQLTRVPGALAARRNSS